MRAFQDLTLNERLCRPIQARFTAQVEYGYYLFTKASAEVVPGIKTDKNTGIYEAGLLQPNIGLYIDRVTFAATCSSDIFSNAVDASFNPAGFSLGFTTSGNRTPASQKPLSFSAFNEGTPIESMVIAQRPEFQANNRNNKDEQLLVYLHGRMKQTPALIEGNFNEISILVSIVAYEILNADAVKKQAGGVRK